MTGKPIHLVAFTIHGPMSHTVLSWTGERSFSSFEQGYASAELWQEVGRILERGKFDAIFFADQLAAYDVYQQSIEPAIRNAIQFPIHDPVVLLPVIACATERLGLATTLSVTYTPPYTAARTLATLDHLSKGRIGWNVVTSFHPNEAHCMGVVDMVPHDERYDRADEYMEVVYKLWNSWEPDALIADKNARVFADPTKVHRINHKGKYFSSSGPLCVAPSPQGRPVIMQAGASERGRDFAAKHAEYVFGLQVFPDAMRSFTEDVRARAKKQGRQPDDIKILFGIQIILGDTEDEARARQEALNDRVSLEGSLTMFSGHTAYDWSTIDLDTPLTDIKVPGIQGLLDIFTVMAGGRVITLREAATMYGRSIGMPQIVGTSSSVADQLEWLMNETGADGFQVTPTYLPGGYADIVEMLVPELQRRNIYRQEYQGTTLREHLNEG